MVDPRRVVPDELTDLEVWHTVLGDESSNEPLSYAQPFGERGWTNHVPTAVSTHPPQRLIDGVASLSRSTVASCPIDTPTAAARISVTNVAAATA